MSQVYNHIAHNKMKKSLSDAGHMSRFSHFQYMNNNLDNVDGMVLVAGMRIPPTSPTSRHQTPGATGVFVTLTMDENEGINDVTTTVVKPTTTNDKGPGFTCSPQNDSDEIVGRVKICQEKYGEKKTLLQRELKLPNDHLKPIVVYLRNHNDQSTNTITVKPTESVDSFRIRLWRELSVSPDETIVCNGKTLTSGHMLGYYKITEKCTMHQMASMIGG